MHLKAFGLADTVDETEAGRSRRGLGKMLDAGVAIFRRDNDTRALWGGYGAGVYGKQEA
jgi:hypothetical protein